MIKECIWISGNNTFLHPPSWDRPDAVAVIIYFSDINITGGVPLFSS